VIHLGGFSSRHTLKESEHLCFIKSQNRCLKKQEEERGKEQERDEESPETAKRNL